MTVAAAIAAGKSTIIQRKHPLVSPRAVILKHPLSSGELGGIAGLSEGGGVERREGFDKHDHAAGGDGVVGLHAGGDKISDEGRVWQEGRD